MDVLKTIESYTVKDDLSTFDPFDVWKTSLGYNVKKLFNRNRYAGLFPAAVITLYDTFINNSLRIGYSKQEYPIVRAFSSKLLTNLYLHTRDEKYLDYSKKHIDWLINNYRKSRYGIGWGLEFKWSVNKHLEYDKTTPLSTATPYILEAILHLRNSTNDISYDSYLPRIYKFFNADLEIMHETDSELAISYAPMKDRIVVNASSYVMYSLALLLPYLDSEDKEPVMAKINKFYSFIINNQNEDGSWYYSPEKGSFIDCFHSFIVLKNLYKTNQLVQLEGSDASVERGYAYLQDKMFDSDRFLYRRFSVANKPGIVKYDLYDNAEALNMALLLDKHTFAEKLNESIVSNFVTQKTIYSQIDLLENKRNPGMLRWAVMPYLYALTNLYIQGKS